MNSRKDYCAAAAIARSYQNDVERAIVVEAFSAFFAGDNPAFSSTRFREACEPSDGKRTSPRRHVRAKGADDAND